MDLDEVKNFLRVDFDDDDTYIQLLIDGAKEYIINAIGFFDNSIARMRILLLLLVGYMYESRSYMIENKSDKVAYPWRSIVLQLQLEYLGKSEEHETDTPIESENRCLW